MHVRGRKPPSVAGFTVLTVGEAKGTAKLQKEHPIGHSRTTPAVVSINLRRPVGIVSAFASLPRCWFKMKCSPNGGLMKTLSAMFLACALLSPAFAANDVKEEERVKESGEVLKEILDIPDNIPQDLLDKAECLVILPSVKKGAFGIGGSYGRGCCSPESLSKVPPCAPTAAPTKSSTARNSAPKILFATGRSKLRPQRRS